MDDFEKFLETLTLDRSGLNIQFLSLASIINVALSLLTGAIISLIYILSAERSKRDVTLTQIIPALSVLMTVIMRMQGGRVAIFFGIFGVLSIVRFRSILTDQKGITFILFAIINGLLIGLGNYVLSAISIFFITAIFISTKRFIDKRKKIRLTVKISENFITSKETVERFFAEKGIKHSFLVSTYKSDLNKMGACEEVRKLEYLIYYKQDNELLNIFEAFSTKFKGDTINFEFKIVENNV
ncbi:MAG TPA: DUF4956 domain-containing protein [Spirochaetota bacterium]|nr:MAG: hypothetical protein BWX91_01601 [Spirochaetes bacterium ADurb.Bin133]HNZ27545.1 DUF4956 domain-containing protein [Spirochaetota bacterium]HOF00484.1 DUF4956 domain-containing protein [Spirochaetota bacterium]HOS32930.1 DUF4956 domain-containing protein [Spirochaetota bacterium]HOS55510.1 DUF4956 domain-containing protein [Spirochaetota bacterium]